MYVLMEPARIAENIFERCKKQNISAKDLCKSVGIGINTVYDIKNRGSYPRVDTLFKLASGLGCTIEDLCTESAENADNGGENT